MTIPEIFDRMDYGPAPESDAEAKAWLDSHGRAFGHWIDGGFTAKAKGQGLATANPASGETLATITEGTPGDIAAAIAAARRAQPEWQGLGGHGRARIPYALARLTQKHARLLAVLESMDGGKRIRESRDIDIPLVARHFYCHAGVAQLIDGERPGMVP